MIIFDEYEYAKKIIQEGFSSNRKMMGYETTVLCKYYRYEGYSDLEIEQILHIFFKKHISSYTYANYYKSIDTKIKNSKKGKIIIPDTIYISQEEWEIIQREPTPKIRKILFVYLVLAKFNNNIHNSNMFYVNAEEKYIYMLAKVRATQKERDEIRSYLYKNNYINVGMYKSVIVLFGKENIEEEDVCMSFIPDDDIIFRYRIKCGENIIKCHTCGKIIKKTVRNRKYCKKCALLVKRGKHTEPCSR